MMSLFAYRKDHKTRPNTSRFSSPSTTRARQKARIVFDDTKRVQASVDDDDGEGSRSGSDQDDEDHGPGNEDDYGEDDELSPMLPIFESSHLDALPVYNLTHAIRLLVVPRCETTLTWDQLRSPQISQFMIKPIQKNILTSHFTRATLYALLANCLQFQKEAADNPGIAGTSRTRAMVCQLLAIRLLKEYSVRELIDALSYDFYPLQGLAKDTEENKPRQWEIPQLTKTQARIARVSTLEIAIRAQAKRFLAHPVVVQQLEAIWAGTIVFHSAADSAHRYSPQRSRQGSGYGSIVQPVGTDAAPKMIQILPRKTVTIYNPSEASLFKLSRLRVPRYRSFFSTLSLAILLGLFVAVLVKKSTSITVLEIVFWLWSAGFMLDEVVGLTDQGFNLYLLSFWNAFDLGILFVLVVFYCLRLYGLVIADSDRKYVASLAYDALGVNAILMFPRLFSVLDHYRYFSQLLIAFRIMARDLVAVLVLIGISCSGFFVAFTLAFGNETDSPYDVAYALFQLIMGFTPAAWERWSGYNHLGQATLVLFMFITHFLIVTILITVLTNSFLAIVQNANDEHQFVFAINTISMVKSDALFSYVAPTNIIAWLLTPLRSCLSFRQYVWLNRTIIKVTHFPILWGICAYERLLLKRSVYEPTDLIERRGRNRDTEQDGLFTSRTLRTRERSMATMVQDKVFEAVFEQPLRTSASRRTMKHISQHSAKPDNVDNWMQQMDTDGPTGPPAEQDRGIVDRLEHRRPLHRKVTPRGPGPRNFTSNMSVLSDPEDFIHRKRAAQNLLSPFADSEWQDAGEDDTTGDRAGNDGDDEEIVTEDAPTPDSRARNNQQRDYFETLVPAQGTLRQPSKPHSRSSMDFAVTFEDTDHRAENIPLPHSKPSTRVSTRPPSRGAMSKAKQREIRDRTLSTNTIVYNPVEPSEFSSSPISKGLSARAKGNRPTKVSTPSDEIANPAPASKTFLKQRRPLLNDRSAFQSAPNLAELLNRSSPRDVRPQHSPYNFDLVSDLGDNKAPIGGYMGMAGMPASFGTHMEFMARSHAGEDSEEHRRMGKLMLARMNTLEQGFREVIREIKDSRRGDEKGSTSNLIALGQGSPRRAGKDVKVQRALGKKRKETNWTAEPKSVTASTETKPEQDTTAE